MKTIALDSYPKLGEINFDYSPSQIYSLCALPLLEPEYFPLPEYKSLHHGEISYKDATKIQVELSCPQFFHNKQPVIAEHYLNRFIFLKKYHPLLKFSLLNFVKIKTKKNRILFIAQCPIEPLEILLRSILFTPKLSPESSEAAGEYSLYQKENFWLAVGKNDAIKNENKLLRFVIIRDPLDNYYLSKTGYLQQTADTATPCMKEAPAGYHSVLRRSSLHSYLLFKNRLALNDNLKIRQSLCALFHKELHAVTHSIRWEKNIKDLCCIVSLSPDIELLINYFKNTHLTISYNDFHPNATIIYTLGHVLDKYNIKYKILEDNYYHPTLKSDISLLIINGFISGEWGQYYNFLFSPVIKANIRIVKNLLNTLNADNTFIEKKKWFAENILPLAPFFYLGEIPSYHFRKTENEAQNGL